jgi:hypothetical protein
MVMNREEIERSFIRAGWEVAELSWPHLLVGNAGDLSILAYRSLAETDDPVFELLHRRRNVTYWARVIPTPRLATVLLEDHGSFTKRPRLSAASSFERRIAG